MNCECGGFSPSRWKYQRDNTNPYTPQRDPVIDAENAAMYAELLPDAPYCGHERPQLAGLRPEYFAPSREGAP